MRLDEALSGSARWLVALRDDGPDLTINAHKKAAHEAVEFADTPTLEEAADVLICMMGAAVHHGWTLGNLADAVRAKTVVNAARTWELQADGTWQHGQPQS